MGLGLIIEYKDFWNEDNEKWILRACNVYSWNALLSSIFPKVSFKSPLGCLSSQLWKLNKTYLLDMAFEKDNFWS